MTQKTGMGGAVIDALYNYQVPLNGFSITVPDDTFTLLLDPAGTLATGTVIMPPNPYDGQFLRVKTSQQITAITISGNAGQSVIAAPTELLAGHFIEAQYRAVNTTWYCST